MSTVRFPAPLRPGDRLGVTAPSAGVNAALRPRMDFAVRTLEKRGYDVTVGDCMNGDGHVSAPLADRRDELTAMLLDPRVRAVVPPRGGSVAIDLLSALDWDAIRAAEPTWLCGYSDISTILLPFTLLTGVATVHGSNLLDTPYEPAPGLMSWLDVAESPGGAAFTQTSPGRYHNGGGPPEWSARPEATAIDYESAGSWRLLNGGSDGEVRLTGRLLGGCVETLGNLAGTPYGDTSAFAERHAPEGLLVYVEVAGAEADEACRTLHGMRLAGFFERATGILVGRTAAPSIPTLTQDEAVLDALGSVGVPIIADVECGHVPPTMPFVNGARATVVLAGGAGRITQTLA
ncbi:S66 peptidase family protein [Actinoplanes sp. NPDC049596]|uniref:S66 family peptidase n=1 Tax=unclassified Actinoplanes TaxID=2626549 RepID=UPI003449E998